MASHGQITKANHSRTSITCSKICTAVGNFCAYWGKQDFAQFLERLNANDDAYLLF
jgi:hypothetical protein